MFCANCGHPLKEDSKFCPQCGTLTNADTTNTESTPAVEPTPVVEPTPIVVPTPAPVKKKGKKGLIAGIAAVLAVVIIGVAALLNIGKIENVIKKNFSSKEDYLIYVTQNKTDKFVKDFTEALDDYTSTEETKAGAKGDFKIELTDKGAELLNQLTGVDLDWADNAVISMDMDTDGKNISMDLALNLNGTKLIAAEMILDTENYVMYAKVPDISEQYIKAAIEGTDDTTIAMSTAMLEQVVDALPDSEILESVLNRYIGVILGSIEEVEKESDTLEVGEVVVKCDKYTLEIDGKLVTKMVKNVLNEAKKDKELEKIIKDAVSKLDSFPADKDEVYKSMLDGIDELLETIDESETPEVSVDYTCWINGNGDIMGIEIDMDGTTVSLLAPEKGKKFAVEFKVKTEDQTISFKGEGTISGSKKSGEFSFKAMGMDIIDIKLIDFDTKIAEKGYYNGSIEIAPSKSLLSMMGLSGDTSSTLGMLSDMKLRLDMTGNEKDKDASFALSVLKNDEKLVSIGMSAKEEDYEAFDIPSSAIDSTDYSALEDWIGNFDITTIFDRLEDAGIPEDFLVNIFG